jgi:hypothetical protein
VRQVGRAVLTQGRPGGDAPAGDLGRCVAREERRLRTGVGAWGLLSVVAGTASWLAGHRRSSALLVGAGRQAVVWGALDLAVAVLGSRRSAEPPQTDAEARRRARRMAAITAANAVADVGYLAGSGWLLRSPRRRADALGAAAQAGFLLVVDIGQARRFARLWLRGASTSRPARP